MPSLRISGVVALDEWERGRLFACLDLTAQVQEHSDGEEEQEGIYPEAGVRAELSHRGGLVVEVDDDTCGEVHRVVGVLVHREALVGHKGLTHIVHLEEEACALQSEVAHRR